MCLDLQWFSESENRRKEREQNGMSLSEAESCLRTYNSSIYPVAVEAAEHILSSWSEERKAMLNKDEYDIFVKICETELSQHNANEHS